MLCSCQVPHYRIKCAKSCSTEITEGVSTWVCVVVSLGLQGGGQAACESSNKCSHGKSCFTCVFCFFVCVFFYFILFLVLNLQLCTFTFVKNKVKTIQNLPLDQPIASSPVTAFSFSSWDVQGKSSHQTSLRCLLAHVSQRVNLFCIKSGR